MESSFLTVKNKINNPQCNLFVKGDKESLSIFVRDKYIVLYAVKE